MSSVSVPQRPSRAARGLSLFREHEGGICELENGFWRVPSERSPGRFYAVHLEAGSCTCADYQRRRQSCKHLFAAVAASARNRRRPSFNDELRARRFRELAAKVARPVEGPESAARSYELALACEAFHARKGTQERALSPALRRRAWARHREVLAANEGAA